MPIIFIENNSISNISTNDKIEHRGIISDNNLLLLMSFEVIGNKAIIHKFTIKNNIDVVSGYNIIFDELIQTYNISEVESYTNNCYVDGNIYESLGFKKILYTHPKMFYSTKGKRSHRSNFTKRNIEKRNLNINQYDRIWDSGNTKCSWK